MRNPFPSFLTLALAVALMVPVLAAGAPEAAGPVVQVDRWLVAGPVAAPEPAFAEATGVGRREPLEPEALLPDWPWEAGAPWPAAGAAFPWPGASELEWRPREGDELILEAGGDLPRLAWIATFVEADRFTRATLTVTTPYRVRVFLDGEAVATKTSVETAEAAGDDRREDTGTEMVLGAEREPGTDGVGAAAAGDGTATEAGAGPAGTATAELELDTGKHLLLLIVHHQDPAAEGGVAATTVLPWTVSATLALTESQGAAAPSPAATPDTPTSEAAAAGPATIPGAAAGQTDSATSGSAPAGADVAGAVASLHVSAAPERGLRIADLLDPPSVAAVDLSADGSLLAVTLEQPAVPADDRSTWVEIVAADDGATVEVLRGPAAVRGFTWAPEGRRYAYRTSEGGETTLWVGEVGGGLRPVLTGIEGLDDHRWAADGGRSLFVTIREEAETDDRGAVRVRSLADRLPGARDLASVHQVSAEDGRRRRLTAGPLSTALQDASPDGLYLLVSRTRFTLERPFSHGELIEIDLRTLRPTLVAEVTWLGDAGYSPDGTRLLVTAGPSAFGDLGVALPEGGGRRVAVPGAAAATPGAPSGAIPNEYDGQAYLVDLAAARAAGRPLNVDGEGGRDGDGMGDGGGGDDGEESTGARHALPAGAVTPITRDFDPAVGAARWSRADGAVYLAVTEGVYGPLYRWHPDGGRFERLEAGPEVVSGISLARTAPVVALAGSSAQEAEAAWVMASPRGGGKPLLAPSAEVLAQVRFGRLEDVDVPLADGSVLPGRLYYPLDFDPAERYPLLTYYYGGVVPTGRSFGGRYPINWWTAHGYAVYVPQPSGAVGYGQERSALHVNDWGERVVEEIVAGVDAVLAAHPFLDPERVGCFGGSYGGFLTMRLVAESDRFAAAISHAGISGIASYWGEGWWGYLYMATAAAGSYPWNRPDLYVERSPLFRADRVETPLLLLHGTSDPNVPPGESDQMFAALRILGKEVEYVRIEGEAHWILTYPKRVLWWRTIMAWFDRHLKDRPEAWEALWGETLDRSGP